MLVPSITAIKLCCSEAKLLGFLGFDDLVVRVAQIRIRITPKIIGSSFIISYPFLILNSPFKWLSAFHIVYMNNMKDNFFKLGPRQRGGRVSLVCLARRPTGNRADGCSPVFF